MTQVDCHAGKFTKARGALFENQKYQKYVVFFRDVLCDVLYEKYGNVLYGIHTQTINIL